MKVYDIFSKREKRRQGEVADVYQYETIPEALRIQILHIWSDVYGPDDIYKNSIRAYRHINNMLCREYGRFRLGEGNSLFESVRRFFLYTKNTKRAIDVIEVSFQYIDKTVRGRTDLFLDRKISPDDAIKELNYRFQEHGVGYQFESGQIIRIDSQLIHSEVVKPALSMLSDPMYEGANDEFLKAHEHYRAQRYEECMNECLKAFESCIKAICDKRGWSYGDKDSLKNLIDIVFGEKLIPAFMQSYFSGLRSTLESGASTLRNRRSGHGQGSTIITVPEYMAAYALHLTASNILFLAKANEEMK